MNAKLPFTINLEIEQGEILVNEGYEEVCELKLIKIDLRSKYAYASDTGTDDEVPVVYLSAGTLTLHTDESKVGVPTVISFPQYIGWRVVSAGVSRYTLTVVLQKQ